MVGFAWGLNFLYLTGRAKFLFACVLRFWMTSLLIRIPGIVWATSIPHSMVTTSFQIKQRRVRIWRESRLMELPIASLLSFRSFSFREQLMPLDSWVFFVVVSVLSRRKQLRVAVLNDIFRFSWDFVLFPHCCPSGFCSIRPLGWDHR